jgi:nascent polypeptide-associated complex subunit alpha
VIAEPEVYKSIAADVYIVYGVATLSNGALGSQAMAAQRYARQQAALAAAGGHKDGHQHADDEEAPEAVAEAAAPDVDEGDDETSEGIDEQDIEMIVSQANCSRSEAIKALKKNSGDVVNAIMELTM